MTKENYIKLMHYKNRCLVFTDNNNIIRGLITFFITDNPKEIIRDGIWGIPKENIDGDYIVIDRCITDHNSPIKPNLIEAIKYFNNRFSNKKVVWTSRGRKNADKTIFAQSIK